jgi:hypothetical protein
VPITATRKAEVAAPSCLNRSAAQSRNGKISHGCRHAPARKTTMLEATTPATSAAASTIRAVDGRTALRAASVRTSRSGATTRIPMASPNHQSSQAPPYVPILSSARVSTVTPFVALITGLRTAPPTTSASTERTRSSAGVKPILATSRAPATAASVFPTVMPAATASVASLVALAVKAPTATAGQKRTPRRSKAASAIPDGGHTGVITPWDTERLMPSFAAPK